MKAIVLGYHNMGCAGIKALLRHGIEIAAIFTYVDSADETIWFDSVAELAAMHDIPVFSPEDINHPLWVDAIKAYNPDVIFSFYYRDMLKQAILQIPSMGCINLHGSMLPSYRGRAPINWVLVNGETSSGVTLHYMTGKPDDGDIIGQVSVDILRDDTAVDLAARMVDAAAGLLDTLLPQLVSGIAPRIPQDNTQASYFGGRTPADGKIDWSTSSDTIYNLVRAVTRPYPGAFTSRSGQIIKIWKATSDLSFTHREKPGTILSIQPLCVACRSGVLTIDYAQPEHGLYTTGTQLAQALNLVEGMRLGAITDRRTSTSRKTRVLILGINGFIGNALTQRLLSDGQFEVHGMDLQDDAITRFRGQDHFYFHEGDISINREWIEYHVKKCDVILPLVAIATPIAYTKDPIRVFELDFEENLRIIRYCVKYNKRIVFPSTSEVYGMCTEDSFNEDTSNLVLGPINKQRWIYSCSKQLLDRVIWAYGKQEGLRFTLFRPFNWIGPRLDSLESARIGSSRAITQLILNLVDGTPIQLIDGGLQKRCFTDLSDGVECLFRIIQNKQNNCDSAIINIGNPDNEASIKELAEMLVELFNRHPDRHRFPPFAGMNTLESRQYYGDGYEDVQHRRPDIENANRLLNWKPTVAMIDSMAETLDFFIANYLNSKPETLETTRISREDAVNFTA